MLLPNREEAYVPERKLTSYLLSLAHPVGKSKARFFRLYGFTEENADLLEHGLLDIARKEEVQEVENVQHGTKYVVNGSLETPHGPTVKVRTVWMIEAEEVRPRLVTTYPA